MKMDKYQVGMKLRGFSSTPGLYTISAVKVSAPTYLLEYKDNKGFERIYGPISAASLDRFFVPLDDDWPVCPY